MTLSDFILEIKDMPFQHGGRDYTGGDCWSVVYLGYRDIKGILLPKYTDEYDDAGSTPEGRKHLSGVIRSHKPEWDLVEDPEAMDVVLFNIGGIPVHVGLMIDRDTFVHCEYKRRVTIESINSVRWRLRREGYYRCRA